ncbi:two-component regulator propeller domain-containing protein [Flammeovirgaceae bacterium SG7u.111]|nr:two-component regulator propeller domain-containing protein [Flammeovirgaceae bacterium SG7u.132]WPO36885.1 two-component regulator propeller domain-containing protein [Flammeovirgaceae bacterium SG7u.111]
MLYCFISKQQFFGSLLKYKLLIKAVLACLVFFVYSACFSQKPNLIFKHLTVEDGLSHNSVWKVFQDSDGLIWISTQNGLNKYNGYTFVHYKHDPSDSTSIANNDVKNILEDKAGNLWISSWGGGISILDKRTNKFKRLVHKAGDSTSISSNYIDDLYMDSKGVIWAETSKNGILLIDPSTQKVIRTLRPGFTRSGNINNYRASQFVEDDKGNMWVATSGNGLNYYNPENGENERVLLSTENPGEENLVSLHLDSKKRLWLGTWSDGVYVLDQDGKTKHFKHSQEKGNSISNNQVWYIAEDVTGAIWLGTDNGISIYDEEGGFYNYTSFKFNKKGLSSDIIKCIYQDNSNRVWVGTLFTGLNVFDKRFSNFEHFFNTSDANSLSYDKVSAFVYDQRGDVLVGTDGGGLNIFDLEKKTFKRFMHNPQDPTSIGSNKIKTILEDSKGRIWIGFWAAGFDRFDPSTGTFTHYKNKGTPNSPNSNDILAIVEDEKGFLWLATYGGGLNKFDVEKGIFEYFVPASSGLKAELLWTMKHYDGYLYTGTGDGLFQQVNLETMEVSTIVSNKEKPEAIQSMKLDDEGNLWIGYQEGFFKYDTNNNKVVRFDNISGLPPIYVNSIELDAGGQVWLGTNNGLYSYDLSTKYLKKYRIEEGLQGLEFSRKASLKLPTGELIFGGNNGFNIFNPDSLKSYEDDFPLIFTSFEVFNKPVEIGEGKPLSAHVNYVEKAVLTYEQSLFSICYASLNYSDPDKVEYRYRLLGFSDENWLLAGRERKATFSNLDQGKYTFEVQALDCNGKQLGEGRTLSIIVLAPWWESLWFRYLSVILCVVSLFVFYKLRIHYYERRNRFLEEKVQERTVELLEKNGEISSQNEELQSQQEELQMQQEELAVQNEELLTTLHKLKLAQSKLVQSEKMASLGLLTAGIAHEINNPINFIKSSIHGLQLIISQFTKVSELYAQVNVSNADEKLLEIEQYKKELKFDMMMDKAEKVTQHIDTGVNRTAEIVKGLRSFSRLDIQTFIAFDLEEAIDNTLLLINHLLENKIEVFRNYEKVPMVECSPGQINQVLMNILVNAAQSIDGEGSIFISLQEQGANAIIKVKDSGIGIPPENLKKVFDPFFTTKEVGSGTGMGLSSALGIVEEHNGSFQVDSKVGEGTTIIITLPFKNDNTKI